jgi:hypothetical protein
MLNKSHQIWTTVITLIFSMNCNAEVISDAEKMASINFIFKQVDMQSSNDSCGAYSPINKDLFKFSNFFWQSENKNYALASEKLLKNFSSSEKTEIEVSKKEVHAKSSQKFNDAPNNKKDNFCGSLLNKMGSTEINFDKTNAGHAELLSKTITSDETIRIQKRNTEMTTGCMKSILNASGGKANFEAVLNRCSCQIKSLATVSTDKEIDLWLANIKKNPVPPKSWIEAQLKCDPNTVEVSK